MSKLATIVIPNYNKAQYVSECIQSVKRQSFSDFDCIIVDDGSTDNSLDAIKRLIADDCRFQLFQNSNHGPSYSRNFAISKADSKYILPLDSDDYIEQTYLERLLKTYFEHPEITLAYGRWQFVGHNADMMNARLGSLHYVGYAALLKGNSIHNCCMYRREDAISCGLYDEAMCGFEDWEFLIRLLYKDKLVAYDPRISLYYRQLEASISTKSNSDYFRKFSYIMHKHSDKYR